MFLGENAGGEVVRSIGLDNCFKVRIEVSEDRGSSECSFQLLEYEIAGRVPVEGNIFS